MTETREREAKPATRGEFHSEKTSATAQWVLLDGDRHLVAAVMLAGLVVILGGVLASGVGAVTNTNSLTRLFAALVGGNLTLVTVAISINQLILSKEFATPDELHDHIRDVVELRREIEEIAGVDVSPVGIGEFLDFLVEQVREHGEQLQSMADESRDGQTRADIERYADTLVVEADRITKALHDRPSGAFHTLRTILDTDFTGDVYAGQLLQARGQSEPDPVVRTLDDVFDLLEYVGVARQYFKGLYIQRELAELSRTLLYVGVPAVTLPALAVFVYGHPAGPAVTGPVLRTFVLVVTVSAAAPLAILVAYVLRIATVTHRTASLMPFQIREDSPL